MSKRSSDANDGVLQELRAFGLAYPGAHTKSPWPGHDDLAVNNKTFAYPSNEGEPFSISVKLPYTKHEALPGAWSSRSGRRSCHLVADCAQCTAPCGLALATVKRAGARRVQRFAIVIVPP